MNDEITAYDFVQFGERLADSLTKAAEEQVSRAQQILDQTKSMAEIIRTQVAAQAKQIEEMNVRFRAFGEQMLDAHRILNGNPLSGGWNGWKIIARTGPAMLKAKNVMSQSRYRQVILTICGPLLLVLATAAVIRASVPSIPNSPSIQIAKAPLETNFLVRWQPVSRLPHGPVTVTTIAIRPTAQWHPAPTTVANAEPPPLPPAKRVNRATQKNTDICARHGLKKIEVIRGKWKGWRCRRV